MVRFLRMEVCKRVVFIENRNVSKDPGPVGRRIRALRVKRGLSQDHLAGALGFKDRQTVSAIETGIRRVSAEELLLAMDVLQAPLDEFTDPFRLVGEGRFSWRQSNLQPDALAAYEERAGRWIAAYRELAPRVGRPPRLLRWSLRLTRRSSFEEARWAGERFAREFELGDPPARRLAAVMGEDLDMLVLMVDAPPEVSGAACLLPEVDTALVSRREVVGRRSFDLAHELFHLLTWDAMPPSHRERRRGGPRPRVEQLADNFAGAVLMPSPVLRPLGAWRDLSPPELIAKLNQAADRLLVSSSALRWRLTDLGAIPRSVARSLPEEQLRFNGGKNDEPSPPPRFSRRFMEVIGTSIEQGLISVLRAAALLDLTIEELGDTLAAHRVRCSVEL